MFLKDIPKPSLNISILLAGISGVFALSQSTFDKWLKGFFLETNTRVIAYFVAVIAWLILWLVVNYFLVKSKSKIRKIKKGKLGFYISIVTENEKQKERIKKDFSNRINSELRELDLYDKIDVVLMEEDGAVALNDLITEYVDSKENRSKFLRRLGKKTGGHFYVYGDISERLDEENKYFLNLEGLVLHSQVDVETSKFINKEFKLVFRREIAFLERFEAHGFSMAASDVLYAARYMIGIAAYVSGNPVAAVFLHKRLKDELQELDEPVSSQIRHMRKNLDFLLQVEMGTIAQYEYAINQNFDAALQLVEDCLAINKKQYDSLVRYSTVKFTKEKKPLEALKILNEAKKYSRGDYTWLYNKAFLLMYMGKFDLALKEYKKLQKVRFPNEEDIVRQCLEYNEKTLREEPEKIQYLFVLGYLNYKKIENLPMALEHFEEFLKQADGVFGYDPLLLPTRSYLVEIKRKMGL